MKSIIADRNAIMAHIYVLHMGDLSGGQMIAKKALVKVECTNLIQTKLH